MLIGHAPLGYLVGTGLRRRYGAASGLIAFSVVGGIAPDFDMLRFWFIDHGQYNHRYYFTHWPLFWLACAVVILPLVHTLQRNWLLPATGFFLGVFSHLATDTVMAPIRWFAPFSAWEYEMFRIPAAYSHWVLSAIGYWTFLLDIVCCILALIVWQMTGRSRSTAQMPPYQS